MTKLVSSVSPGAVMLIVNLEFSPGAIVDGENDLLAEMPLPARYTRTRAVAEIPLVIPWSVTSALSGIVLVYVAPDASAGVVTWTVIVQVPGVAGAPGGTLPFVSVTVRGGVIVTEPPQVVAADPGTTVNTSPGRVSAS